MTEAAKNVALGVVCVLIALSTYVGVSAYVHKANSTSLVTQAVCKSQNEDRQTWVTVLSFLQKRTLANPATKNKAAAIAAYSSIIAELPPKTDC